MITDRIGPHSVLLSLSIAPCTRDFSHVLGNLEVIAKNSDWFVTLFAPVVIRPSNHFGIGFVTVFCKQLYFNNLGESRLEKLPSLTRPEKRVRSLTKVLLKYQSPYKNYVNSPAKEILKVNQLNNLTLTLIQSIAQKT